MAPLTAAAENTVLSGDHGKHRRSYKDAVACEDCRKRKRKCDGVRPICGTCTKRKANVPCTYTSRRSPDETNSRFVQQLLNRIDHLESTVVSNGNAQASDATSAHLRHDPSNQAWSPPRDGVQQAISADGHASMVDGHSQQRTISDYPPALPPSTTGDAEDSDHDGLLINGRVDAMGSVSGNANDEVVGNAPDGRVYFGTSSTLSFMNQVQNVLDTTVGHLQSETPDSEITDSPVLRDFLSDTRSSQREHTSSPLYPDGLSHIRNRRSVRSQSKFDVFSLPSRQDANELVASYWKWVHCLYPFLDQENFNRRYAELWSPTPRDSLAHKFSQYQAQHPSMRSKETQIRLFQRAVRSENVLFHCIVNLVFALGSQFHSEIDPAERSIHGDAFYQRAKRLLELDFNIMSHGCVQLVQTFLLMSQYVQTSEMSGGCWNVVATATRAAQTIGLHLDVQKSSRHDLTFDREKENEINLRMRLWGGCVWFDRVLAMTYGRPFMIESTLSSNFQTPSFAEPTESAPLRTETDDISYSSPKYLAFYDQTLRHVDILKVIVSTFYREAGGSSLLPDRSQQLCRPGSDHLSGHKQTRNLCPADIQAFLELEDSLQAWRNQLPEHLQVVPLPDGQNRVQNRTRVSNETTKVYARQANVLQARYLHSRIMLFRPALLQLCALSHSRAGGHQTAELEMSELLRAVVVQAATMCISAARELTDLIYCREGLDNEVLPEWWYNVFYIYTCATAFLAAQLCTQAFELLDSVPLRQSWEKCLESLKMYQVCSISAQRCLRVLELIDQRLQNKRKGTNAQSASSSTRQTAASHATMASSTGNTHRQDPVSGQKDVERGNMTEILPSTSTNPPNETHFMVGVIPENVAVPVDLSSNDLGLGWDDWTQSPLDFEWLTSAPFDMDYEGPIAEAFVL